MLFDFNEAWARAAEARYDVCVCGTGPAGITIARKLAARGKKVLLLEGGGLSYSEQSQDHYKGKNVGRTIWLDTSRLRYLGGTSNHWDGLCAVQDPITFEDRGHTGLPGWPISRDEILANLKEAKDIVDIVEADLSTPQKQPGFDSPLFGRYAFGHSPPTRFFEKYGAEIKQSKQIDAFYNANLIDLTLSDDHAQVKSFRVRNYNGNMSDLSAAQYVLALGGIENPRMLLNANHQAPSGIGNHSGMVGRCFMNDLGVEIGRFMVTDPEFWQRQGRPAGQVLLTPSESLMRERDIGNGVLEYMSGLPAAKIVREFGRLRVVKEFIHQTGCYWPSLTELARKFVEFDCPGDGIIRSIIEQQPNPDSRITLINDVDSFGLRRIQMNWQLMPYDLKTIRVLSIESAKEMARLNKARVQLSRFILDTSRNIPVYGEGHHMGTTRMSADPRYGVVDQNCRVHGMQNLYIAGCSVFPKGGGKNPTLTIVLLALRLGDVLAKA
jgi:choline dehydrogenase-like flavoprotein